MPEETRPSTIKVWLLASRPHTLTASISPVVVGYNLCKSHYSSQSNATTSSSTTLLGLTFLWVCFCICVQLGTNLHNDYADFVKGADTDKRVGQARATQKGWLTPEQTCRGCDTCLILALAIGFRLAQLAGGDGSFWNMDKFFLFGVVFTSVFNAVAYTGGPYPLGCIGLSNVSIAYSGLGDLFAFLYFGLVATMALPYLVLRSSTHRDASLMEVLMELKFSILIALPVGWLATAIIVVNNLRDRETDVHAKKRTVAVRFGGLFCRIEYAILIISSFVWHVLVLFKEDNRDGWYQYLPILFVPMAIPQLRAVSFAEKDYGELNPHVGGTAKLQLFFCILLSFSLRSIN